MLALKSINKNILLLSALLLFAAGCSQEKRVSTPSEVALEFLNEEGINNYEKSYALFSLERREDMSFEEYKNKNSVTKVLGEDLGEVYSDLESQFDIVAKSLADQVDYSLVSENIIGNQAEVIIHLTVPNYFKLMMNIFTKALANPELFFSPNMNIDNMTDEQFKYFVDKMFESEVNLDESDLIKTKVTVELVKEDGVWFVQDSEKETLIN